MVLNREAFRKRERRTVDVEIEGLGEVRIADVSARCVLDLRQKYQGDNDDMTGDDAIAFFTEVSAAALVDDKGTQLFDDKGEELRDLPFSVIEELGEAVLRHNGLAKDEADPTTASSGSTSSG